MTTVFNNAQLILSNEVVKGHLIVEGEKIVGIDQGQSSLPSAIDMDDMYIMPGMVELHTDNMEKYFEPRPGVDWPGMGAAVAHDQQMVSAGVTTVFDAVAVGSDFVESRKNNLPIIIESLCNAEKQGFHKAEHFLHLRCEVSTENTYEEFLSFASNPMLRLASLMDHAPGQRQFADFSKYRQYYQGKYKYNDTEMDAFIEKHLKRSEINSKPNRDAIVEHCKKENIALASHDDALEEHVQESIEYGVSMAEFPTTVEAAKMSHENKLHVMMGAPNLIRGKSHSGNVSASELAEGGYLDIISSDYYPSSLLQAAFKLADSEKYDLAAAIKCVSKNPAEAVGLEDRGELKTEKLADFVVVKKHHDMPLVEQVWRRGKRIC